MPVRGPATADERDMRGTILEGSMIACGAAARSDDDRDMKPTFGSELAGYVLRGLAWAIALFIGLALAGLSFDA